MQPPANPATPPEWWNRGVRKAADFDLMDPVHWIARRYTGDLLYPGQRFAQGRYRQMVEQEQINKARPIPEVPIPSGAAWPDEEQAR